MWMMALGFFSTAHTFTCRPVLSAACTQRANSHRTCCLSRLDGIVCTRCYRQGLGPAHCNVGPCKTNRGFLYYCYAQQHLASKKKQAGALLHTEPPVGSLDAFQDQVGSISALQLPCMHYWETTAEAHGTCLLQGTTILQSIVYRIHKTCCCVCFAALSADGHLIIC